MKLKMNHLHAGGKAVNAKRDVDWVIAHVDVRLVDECKLKPPSRGALALWRAVVGDEKARQKFLLEYYGKRYPKEK